MSLLDPREAAERDRIAFRGSARALTATLIAGVLSLAAASVIGFAIGGLFEQFRIMSLNSVFSTWETAIPVEARGWGLPVGILGSLITISQYAKWNHRYTGRQDGFAIVGPLTIVLAGLAIGTWVATTMWTTPDAVGVAVDPTFGEDEAWDAGAWILYAAQWWLPGLFALLTVLSLLGRVLSRSSRERRQSVVEQLLRSGTRVEAEVTQVPLPDPHASRSLAPVVAKFTDAWGTDRWITCTVMLPPQEFPKVGDRRPLVFDPANPGDTGRIFFSATGATDPESFQAVRAAS